MRRRDLQWLHGTYLYCFDMVERMQIGIVLIAGAVEINFVLYDANIL